MDTPPAKPFQTGRTRRLRATDLDVEEDRAVTGIETFGCEIMTVSGGPQFAYSVGLQDTSSLAEIITIGLKPTVAQALINYAADAARQGTDLTKGRHRELIGEVECEFRPVDPTWIEHVMGWASWYYGHEPFPVLQAIYPDRENRFPGEAGFNEAFAQPMLQPGIERGQLENDFWASNDPESSLMNWPFTDQPHTSVFLSAPVHRGDEPITYVSHDVEDGAWQFLGDSMSNGEKPAISCFHHPVDQDPTLRELADLPTGWYAERATPADPWQRHEHEPDAC